MLGAHQLSLILSEAFPRTGWTAGNWHSACLAPPQQVVRQETILTSRKGGKESFQGQALLR